MHPLILLVLIGCAVWFFSVATMAGRGTGVRIVLTVLGIVEFVLVAAVFEAAVRNQHFFRQALRSGPDIGPIMTYIMLPTAVVVFLTGLVLRKVLRRPQPAESADTRDS
jgi:uncharacterized membrane protein YedE/YeeE